MTSENNVTVRFAPSPTGRLHVGNTRTALVNWLYARKAGGTFLLRMDDTDDERSTEEYATGIEEDLTWLGLTWDRFARQSDRLERYDAAVEKLKASGRLYPCYETQDELGLKRKAQLSAGGPPVYDRAALKLSDAEKAEKEASGIQPHWRFLLLHEEERWTDLVRGESHYHMTSLSDPVLLRADGRPIYTLASVVDDIELGVTHILRGEDHLTNSAAQMQLFKALGAEPPVMGHLSLLTDVEGQGLSKRLGSLSLEQLRADGLEAMAVNTLLAKIGTSDPVEPRQRIEQLVEDFDISKFSRATPGFDPAELEALNAKILHETDFALVSERLAGLGIGGGEAFWLAVRGNLEKLADAALWWQVCEGEVDPLIEDADYAAAAAQHLPAEPWDTDTWRSWADTVKAETGRKGKQLFMPLREAVTGQSRGPDMADLLPLIPRGKVLARLQGQRA
ncbi:glutamate--tRNA ligase [Nisaea acidiphila]|uniref:Glutamate--tRNA ligase n=1 Tax=Nisaea acidiphila TaxID=1862145 RepID=A0A9J7AQX1_9PROT|nr:glutamate--tRNA ligase [Nisaea acidiphila]UUX49639.1 glutamate--tRNA ligase [Nisaea acidiphila]